MSAREATTNNATISGSRKSDRPKPIPPIASPIAIPTIGKMYMYLAIVSRLALFDGSIVKNENTEPISLSMDPPPKI